MVVSDKCNKDNLCSGSITPSLSFRTSSATRQKMKRGNRTFTVQWFDKTPSLSCVHCRLIDALEPFFFPLCCCYITNVPRCETNKRLSALIYGCASFRAEDRDVKMSLEAMVTRYVNVGPIKTCSETCGTTRLFNTFRNIPTLWGFSYFIETLLNNASSTCS